MAYEIDRAAYAAMFGPTSGDKVRLACIAGAFCARAACSGDMRSGDRLTRTGLEEMRSSLFS